jgi:hypothetical protein
MGMSTLTSSAWNAPWNLAWRSLSRRLIPRSPSPICLHLQGIWHWRGKRHAVLIEGCRYCREQCLETALGESLRRVCSASPHLRGSHRVPLGLLLLSRQQLTADELRIGLESQRAAGRGRIGEWLCEFGFVTQRQITAALARQWSCPVLRPEFSADTNEMPQIPLALLQSFAMVPVSFVPSASTVHIAFAEGIDYGALYAIEQMTGCRTEPCMADPDFIRQRLQALGIRRPEADVVFDRLPEPSDLSRVIRSYSMQVAATEIRLAACRSHLWARLFRRSLSPLDLLCDGGDAAAPSPSGRSRSI